MKCLQCFILSILVLESFCIVRTFPVNVKYNCPLNLTNWYAAFVIYKKERFLRWRNVEVSIHSHLNCSGKECEEWTEYLQTERVHLHTEHNCTTHGRKVIQWSSKFGKYPNIMEINLRST